MVLGDSSRGQCGVPEKQLDQWHTFHYNDNVKLVCAGSYSSCIVTDTSVYMCGLNNRSQLGLRGKAKKIRSFHKTFEGKIASVSMSTFHSLLLTDKQHLYAVGNNRNGQCAQNYFRNKRIERWSRMGTKFFKEKKICSIAAVSTCTFIATEHNIYFTGGTFIDSTKVVTTNEYPYFVSILEISNGIRQMSGANNHVVFVYNNGSSSNSMQIEGSTTVVSLGSNEHGQLGLSNKQMQIPNHTPLQETVILDDIKSVDAGGYSTLLLTSK
jgi:alpha-tubulin suppressor-like RCC1 family protein